MPFKYNAVKAISVQGGSVPGLIIKDDSNVPGYSEMRATNAANDNDYIVADNGVATILIGGARAVSIGNGLTVGVSFVSTGTTGLNGNPAVGKAAAIASPTSDTVGTKAAIDAIRVAIQALGITL